MEAIILSDTILLFPDDKQEVTAEKKKEIQKIWMSQSKELPISIRDIQAFIDKNIEVLFVVTIVPVYASAESECLTDHCSITGTTDSKIITK
jgi:hypothetical protein